MGKKPSLNVFQSFLSIWVLLAMVLGVVLGKFVPVLRDFMESASVAQVSIPIAVLLWGMIMPMMLQIDFFSITNFWKHSKAVILTSSVNYLVQPFSMYAFAYLFFKVIFLNYLGQQNSDEYLVGSILLGGAPCTAMVFVWSVLMEGDAVYTLTQVAVNDVLLIALYSPTVKLLVGSSNINMPWDTLLISVGIFILVPLILGFSMRYIFSLKKEWLSWLELKLIPTLDSCSMVFLLLMVMLLFISQASTITQRFIEILIISIPLLIQTFFIWGLTYGLALWLKLPYKVAGPATLIACSNFFEMAVAIAVTVYGPESGVALATVVGVLIEVPVMLILVGINNRTKHLFANNDELQVSDVQPTIDDPEVVVEADPMIVQC